METPSSLRRVTRSQTTSSVQSQKSKQEDGVVSRSRTVLLDITNDSPIIGLAKKTPLLSMSKSFCEAKKTPGSGEALLRGQVKTLLQKVEEEAEVVNKISESNTSQLDKILIAPPVVVVNGDPEIKQKVDDLKSIDCLINRALLFDSPGKAKTHDHVIAAIDKEDRGDDDDEDDDEEECLDELIDGLMKMSMQENEKRVAEFAGKHTRFVYNSDDEIEREEEVGKMKIVSPSVLVLKGLPVSEGKHLRFQDEDEDEDEDDDIDD